MGFYIFAKFITIFIRPLFWLLLLPVWAILTKNSKRGKILLIISVCIGFLCSNKVVINELAILWEVEQSNSGKPYPHIAVVLGGFCEYDEARKTISISEEGERIYKVMELYNRGIVDSIIISGGPASYFGAARSEAYYARKYLIEFGIDSNKVFAESKSMNTYENAINTKNLLNKLAPEQPVLLTTSAFHMKRAMACFKKQGLICVPYPVHFISNPAKGYTLADYLLPSTKALYQFDQLSKEWIGYLGYKITGKL